MNPIISGRQPSALADRPASPSPVTELPRPYRRRDPDEKIAMPDVPDECWSRVKKRLHAELGEAIYTSWFARMELESLDPRNRPHLGAHPLPEELDPVPLQRAAAGLLAGRAPDRAAHRPLGPLGGDPHRATLRDGPGRRRRRRNATPATTETDIKALASPGSRPSMIPMAALRSIPGSHSIPSWSDAPTRSPMPPPSRWRWGGATTP